jgi:hypothetical protein
MLRVGSHIALLRNGAVCTAFRVPVWRSPRSAALAHHEVVMQWRAQAQLAAVDRQEPFSIKDSSFNLSMHPCGECITQQGMDRIHSGEAARDSPGEVDSVLSRPFFKRPPRVTEARASPQAPQVSLSKRE